MGPSIRYRKSVHEKEVVVQKATEVLTEIHEGWTPDIVVGIDFGMTYTGECQHIPREQTCFKGLICNSIELSIDVLI